MCLSSVITIPLSVFAIIFAIIAMMGGYAEEKQVRDDNQDIQNVIITHQNIIRAADEACKSQKVKEYSLPLGGCGGFSQLLVLDCMQVRGDLDYCVNIMPKVIEKINQQIITDGITDDELYDIIIDVALDYW